MKDTLIKTTGYALRAGSVQVVFQPNRYTNPSGVAFQGHVAQQENISGRARTK